MSRGNVIPPIGPHSRINKKRCVVLACLDPGFVPWSSLQIEAIFSASFEAGPARKWRRREGRDRVAMRPRAS
jgi:hypothetical protein